MSVSVSRDEIAICLIRLRFFQTLSLLEIYNPDYTSTRGSLYCFSPPDDASFISTTPLSYLREHPRKKTAFSLL